MRKASNWLAGFAEDFGPANLGRNIDELIDSANTEKVSRVFPGVLSRGRYPASWLWLVEAHSRAKRALRPPSERSSQSWLSLLIAFDNLYSWILATLDQGSPWVMGLRTNHV